MTGRVALVTGSSRGIGRAIAVAFARAGACVVVNYLNHEEEGHAVQQEIVSLGMKCTCIQADVTKAKEVARLVAEAEQSFGQVDVLVNNAGIIRPQAIAAITEQDWDEIMTGNLKSSFLMTQAVLPGMRKRQWGRIISLSSVAAQLGGVVGPHYAASKAGLHGMTHYYARHLAKEGITANVIAPALIATEMVRSNPNAKADLIPVGRFGECEEVAEVAVMLANNGYITGQTINVNGGWYMS
ncbi:MAG TPA: 3-oxoacyl-ACP reductase family protein [Bryobacteraceae bacterium]|nr:3-oxoacyl-ACP reductase family protein [Bryobacteraceae bacterium]